jgi:hypothetical protein
MKKNWEKNEEEREIDLVIRDMIFLIKYFGIRLKKLFRQKFVANSF